MGTIYEIVGDIKALSSLIESITDEETGEVRELTPEEQAVFSAWIKEETEAFDAKFDRTCKFYKNLCARADECEAERKSHKEEMDRLSKRAKARENAALRVKDLIWFAFDALGKKKHETALFSAGVQNTAASVKLDSTFDVLLVPSEYWKAPELSSSAIKEGLEDGRLFQKPDSENPLERDMVFIKETGKAIPGIRYSKGSTLVVR